MSDERLQYIAWWIFNEARLNTTNGSYATLWMEVEEKENSILTDKDKNAIYDLVSVIPDVLYIDGNSEMIDLAISGNICPHYE